MCFYLNIRSNFSNVQLEVSEFNNACHKNMYKYVSPGSFRRRIYFPLCIWVSGKNVKSETVVLFCEHFFSGWGSPSPLIDERWEEGRSEVEILACLENNTRHDSEIFFVWKLHVLPFPCFSFPFTKVLRWIHWSSEFWTSRRESRVSVMVQKVCWIIEKKYLGE